eukprot:scaffold1356_cov123-Cylindrotheca_fusiformis.AAC.10
MADFILSIDQRNHTRIFNFQNPTRIPVLQEVGVVMVIGLVTVILEKSVAKFSISFCLHRCCTLVVYTGHWLNDVKQHGLNSVHKTANKSLNEWPSFHPARRIP